jgi:hypothetical protein
MMAYLKTRLSTKIQLSPIGVEENPLPYTQLERMDNRLINLAFAFNENLKMIQTRSGLSFPRFALLLEKFD